MHVSGCPCNGFGGEYAKCECEHWRQVHAMNAHTSALEAHARRLAENDDKDARIAELEAQVKALTAERDAQVWIAKLAYAERDVARGLHAEACKERDAQAEAVRVLMAAAHPDSSGRVVCSSDLTARQIAEAQARGRWFVLDGGIGFALVPWKLTTDKDRAREHGWDNITPALPMAYTEDNPIARAAVEGGKES